MKPGLGALAPPLLVREQALAQVREAIIDGRLAPGTRLIERELCEAMGISRASVRETIRRLEAERLVTVAPRRGPVVASPTRQEAREIYEVRAMLEALLVRRFAEVASEAEVATLADIFAKVERAAERGAAGAIVGLMRRFNDHLVAVVGHGLARDLLADLDARISRLRLAAMAEPGRLAASIEEYRGVLSAIAARDGAEAARRVEASAANAREAALHQLPRKGATPRTPPSSAPRPRARPSRG